MTDLVICVACVGLSLVLHSVWPIAIFIVLYLIASVL